MADPVISSAISEREPLLRAVTITKQYGRSLRPAHIATFADLPATGIRFRTSPFRPDRIFEALVEKLDAGAYPKFVKQESVS